MLSAKSTECSTGQVLLVVHINTFFVELIRLAKFLSNKSGQKPVIMFYTNAVSMRDVAIAQASGISCIDHLGRPLLNAARQLKLDPETPLHDVFLRYIRYALSALEKLVRKGCSLARKFSAFEILYQILALSQRRRFLQRFLRCSKPYIVVLGGDMVGYDTSAFIGASHKVGIPVAVVPSTMSNGLEQAEVYFDDPRHGMSSWLNRFVAAKYPKWLFEHKGRKLLRENGGRAIAMEWLGLAPPLPWIFNSGDADAIALESAAMKEYYIAAGLQSERLIVTGAPSDDAMALALFERDGRKRDLYEKLGLPYGKPMLLTALPPDFLYVTGGRPQCDFSDYKDLVEFWMGVISQTMDFNIVVCLHPSVTPESMSFLESQNTKIATIPTAELIPLCDIYVASVSSTIRWAIACGKPVINYDVYRYRYTDYVNLEGVLSVEEQQEFANLLCKLATDDNYRRRLSNLQAMVSNQWGMLDGQSGERILTLFRKLANENVH